jgi:hypothetical protein
VQYEETPECWTVGQLLSASGYDPKAPTTVIAALVQLIRAKDVELQREFTAQLTKGNEILDGLVRQDYVSVLVEAEERNKAPGYADRLRWLNTRRSQTGAGGAHTRHHL